MSNKIEEVINISNNPKLTPKQKELVDLIEQYEYDISFRQLSNILGKSIQAVEQMVDKIEEKGL